MRPLEWATELCLTHRPTALPPSRPTAPLPHYPTTSLRHYRTTPLPQAAPLLRSSDGAGDKSPGNGAAEIEGPLATPRSPDGHGLGLAGLAGLAGVAEGDEAELVATYDFSTDREELSAMSVGELKVGRAVGRSDGRAVRRSGGQAVRRWVGRVGG